MVTSECLAEDTILAFAEGRLEAAAVRVLEAHTRSCASCSELLAATLGVVHGASPGTAEPVAASISRGTAIGRYLVLAPVGRGGMGEVFAAYDPELDRKVALKLLHSETGTQVASGRLLREAKAIARLSHPNVVVVHDAGTFDDRVFIAMEFLDGQTVAAWLAQRPRSQRQILDVFLAAARGLGAAHAAGLVHRDFKPQNVMVTSTGSVRVMDFGLARVIDADADAGAPASTTQAADAHGAPARWDVTLTQTGELLGTPLYMAPEQFQAQRTDAQTDQFSFCVALYQALYGAHPFRTASFAELMADVTTSRVQAAPAKSAVPAWIRRVLLRGLSVAPQARWPSMDALIAALEHDPARARRRLVWGAVALAGLAGLGLGVARLARRPVALCQAGGSRVAAAWEDSAGGPRHQLVRDALLATGLAYASQTWDRVSTLLDSYTERWLAMYRDSCEATHIRGEQSAEVLDLRTSCLDERLTRLRALVDVLGAADRDTVANAIDAVNGLPALDRCADLKQLRSPVEPPADVEASRRVDALRTRAATVDAFNLTGKQQQALSLSRSLLAEARTLGYRPLVAELLERRWAFNFSLKDAGEPIADLEEAFSTALATRRDDVAADAAALLSGIAGYYQAQHRDGERWANLADALFERLGPGHDLGRGWVAQNRSAIRMQANDLDAALAFQRQALVLKARAYPHGSGDLAASMTGEAEILFRRGDVTGALARAEEASKMFQRVYGAGAGGTSAAINLGNRGEYLVALNRLPEALAAFQEALARHESLLGPRHLYLAYPLTGIGVIHWKSGQADRALAPLERALAIREASEPDLTQRAETRFALARALWDAAPDHGQSRDRDRARARRLATAALGEYQRPPSNDKQAREVTTWLAAHHQD